MLQPSGHVTCKLRAGVELPLVLPLVGLLGACHAGTVQLTAVLLSSVALAVMLVSETLSRNTHWRPDVNPWPCNRPNPVQNTNDLQEHSSNSEDAKQPVCPSVLRKEFSYARQAFVLHQNIISSGPEPREVRAWTVILVPPLLGPLTGLMLETATLDRATMLLPRLR